MIIQTNLDETLVKKIDYLIQATRLPISDIVKNSIAIYYELIRVSPKDRLKAFEESGFIGCGEGDAHLSINYKKDLMELLEQKNGHR